MLSSVCSVTDRASFAKCWELQKSCKGFCVLTVQSGAQPLMITEKGLVLLVGGVSSNTAAL